MERTILHSDANSFYASVEHLHHPELRGKPLAVGGDPASRHGIVLTADYAARRRGVKTGMALWQAREVCPELLFLPPRMDLYLRFSAMAGEIYREYSDRVEPFGIDESWIDVTETVTGKEDGCRIAREISRRIREELGITVSIGVSFDKIYAKLGSDYKKPDAITTMFREEIRRKAWPLPVSDLLYVGKKTKQKLRSLGIQTIGDLACTEESILEEHLGKAGSMIWTFANGLDETPVRREQTQAPVKSIGNGTTLPRDLTCDEDVKLVFYLLAESVSSRLRKHGFRCRVVEICVRDNALCHITRQHKLAHATDLTDEIAGEAFRIFKESYHFPKPVRSLELRGSSLVTAEEPDQLDLFCSEERREKLHRADTAVDEIRRRFGYFSVQRGLMLRDRGLSALDCEGTHTVHPRGYFG